MPAEPSLMETIALGLLQGPAELLPVSSSAHVGLLPWALGWRHATLPGAARKEVEVALHAGTALALLALDSRRPRWKLLAAATAPPALAGLALEGVVERRLGTPRTIAAGLAAGAVAMAAADAAPGLAAPGRRRLAVLAASSGRRRPTARRVACAGVADGAWLGVAQVAALFPGVSRSGATRAAARARGFGRADAASLSREVALPVLVGASGLKGLRLLRRRPPAATVRALAAGAGAATFSTAAALRLERQEAPLAGWAAYRLVLAAAIGLAGSRG